MANASASGLLAESIASLSKSAYQAFAEIEHKAQSQVAQAISDAREARIERDAAVNELHASQLEGQRWKQDVISCKASLKQAELSVTHQEEIIAQLRREATQWKDQSRNWQEHFLRVEQERCGLTTRIDELVAERLQRGLATAFTPKHHPTDSAALSSPAKRSSTSSLTRPPAYKSVRPNSPPEVDSASSRGVHNPTRSTPKSSKVSKYKGPPSPTGDLPPYEPSNPEPKPNGQTPRKRKVSPRDPVVIRRVHAVINVKREDSDEEPSASETKGAGAGREEHATKLARPLRRRRRTIIREDDDDNEDLSGQDEIRDDSYEDEGEGSDDDDDDDELMMGTEENHHELYGTRRVKAPKKTRTSAGESLSVSPIKKRKLTDRENPPVKRKVRVAE